ncbi:hypothetical protein [Jeongeupia chitinilytica]|uniref:Uncharacterized protein n=1 Tax=Jeongeupia chitinilytica TaxID=1041641 RepID=A0ABQ3H5P7_9NEIS|nr:hypothetical protein [Jeongeupia chitinilytica]GHD68437.1 hypothetical protein GCM10007350_33690 [Jeongeupia chitinilytica]
MRTFTELELIAALEESGAATWQEFFVLNGKFVAYENSQGKLMAKLIEDNDLYQAAREFLLKNGKARAL